MRQIERKELIELIKQNKSNLISEQAVHVMFLTAGFDNDILFDDSYNNTTKKIEENNVEKETKDLN